MGSLQLPSSDPENHQIYSFVFHTPPPPFILSPCYTFNPHVFTAQPHNLSLTSEQVPHIEVQLAAASELCGRSKSSAVHTWVTANLKTWMHNATVKTKADVCTPRTWLLSHSDTPSKRTQQSRVSIGPVTLQLLCQALLEHRQGGMKALRPDAHQSAWGTTYTPGFNSTQTPNQPQMLPRLPTLRGAAHCSRRLQMFAVPANWKQGLLKFNCLLDFFFFDLLPKSCFTTKSSSKLLQARKT